MNTRRMLASLNLLTAASLMLSCSGNSPTNPTPNLPPSETETTLVQDYAQIFSETIPRPAYHVCGSEKVTTTAYLPLSTRRSRLLTLYTSIDGKSVTRQSSSTVMPPAGPYKALVVIVRYPETFTDSALGLWEAAQRAISNDYATYTASKGRHGPIVTFDHTNVLMDPSQIAAPAASASVKIALEQQGRSLSGYDF